MSDTESVEGDIAISYSVDLNVNYIDTNSESDSGDNDYDTLEFLVCMNRFSSSPLDYS